MTRPDNIPNKKPVAETPEPKKGPATAQQIRGVEDDTKSLKNLIKVLLATVIISMAVMSTAAVLSFRAAQGSKETSEQNNRFLGNFSNYMRCLIVNEDEVIIAIGEEAYVNLCDELLFLGTGEKPNVIRAEIPKDFPTTTTTQPSG
jgi:hypothetical protein